MKISSISFNNFKIRNKSLDKKEALSINNQVNEKLPMPKAAQVLAFCGGRSLSLKSNLEQISPEKFPPDIHEAVIKEVEAKNPQNKTLYDIHFEKYKGVLDCYSLEELKANYPEFQDVISAYDIEAKPDSFIGKFQNDELEMFSFDDDLTLELIKLYWGEGYSLNDLSKFIASLSSDNKGINLYYPMTKKLNIPLMDFQYAQNLKLSNREYNEKFTQEMSIRLKEAAEAREQKAQGEPVIIPRGELSEAHKQHISEGLKKYYSEHPEKIYEMSKRQKDFYVKNPQKAQEMSEVMQFAWNKTHEGQSLARDISKFAKKYKIKISADDLSAPIKLEKEKQDILSAFWKKNGSWAAKKLSIAMEKAYKEIKIRADLISGTSVSGVKISYNTFPTKMQKEILKWAKDSGYDVKDIKIGMAAIFMQEVKPDSRSFEIERRTAQLVRRYESIHPEMADKLATCLHYTLVDLYKDLEGFSPELLQALNGEVGKLNVLKYAFNAAISREQNSIFNETPYGLLPRAGSDMSDILAVYSAIMFQALTLDTLGFADYMNKKLDDVYDKFLHMEIPTSKPNL